MLGLGSRRPAPPLVAILVAVATLAACNPTPSVAPSVSTAPLSSGVPTASGAASPSPGASLGAVGSLGPTNPPVTPGVTVAPPASVEPFTPPPAMEPTDDQACLDLASRRDVEDALDLDVGDISAEGTDPNTALTCTYPASGSYLLIATMIADSTSFDAERDVAVSYGQEPQNVNVGDRAFYAARTVDAPEQVTFVKGPVLVRMWNQTPATIGRAAFEALAKGVANAIHAEIPPAP